jgi:hypothetical protein
VRTLALVAAALLAVAPALTTQDSTPPASNRLPFSREENADGARFVWFIMGRAGFPYEYVAAKDFPTSSEFTQVEADSARAGDVAWWPSFVAIYGEASDTTLVLPEGEVPLAELVHYLGVPRFYRKLVPR